MGNPITPPDKSWLQWIKIKLGWRDNEYDTGKPGKSREATGLIRSLPPEKQRAILNYRGPEILGGVTGMVELNLNDIHVPESEIRKAYDAGYAAKVDGKPKEGACPFVLPAMQRAWLAGYEFAATLSDNPHEPQ